MLTTLIKHEWKASWKLMLILNGAVFLMFIVGDMLIALGIQTDVLDKMELDGKESIYTMVIAGYTSFYFMGMMILFFGVFIYYCARFYRNLYTDQGYLMHTLPVNQHELIISKALVCIIWRIIGIIIVAVGILGLVMSWDVDWIFDTFAELLDMDMFVIIAMEYLFMFFVMLIYSTLMAYASISIGQRAKKNKVLASVGVYLGLTLATQIISSMISTSLLFFDVKNMINDSKDFILGHYSSTILVSSFVYLLLSGLFYWITHNMMKDNLNLD